MKLHNLKFRFLMSGFFVLSSLSAFAQATYMTLGYSSVSEVNNDIIYFGQHALSVNSNQQLSFQQPRKGFNIGFGKESVNPDEEGTNLYRRIGIHYSYFGGKNFKNTSNFKTAMNAFDANFALGLGKGYGRGESMFAFYGILGVTTGYETIKLGSEYNLKTSYSVVRTGFSGGVGIGSISTSGSGLVLDVLFAKPTPNTKHVFSNGSDQLPQDYDAYRSNPTNYTGGLVGANWSWIRAEIKLILPLSNN